MTAYQGQEDLDPLIVALRQGNPDIQFTGDNEKDLLILNREKILVINVAGAVAVENAGGELIHA